MTRYEKLFKKLSKEKRGAFIPFTVLGDPDLETSYEIVDTLLEAGADALELGIPFSDPVADGPVIQSAVVRALESGTTVSGCFETIARIRAKWEEAPIGVLTYLNTIMCNGTGNYFSEANRCGIDSILAADMPVEESAQYCALAKEAGVAPVFIAPPNADSEKLEKIASATRGYTYVVTRRGVTGGGETSLDGFIKCLEILEKFKAPPPVAGFGISRPEHVNAVTGAGAAGAISGSATVDIVNKHKKNRASMKKELSSFVKIMKEAAKK